MSLSEGVPYAAEQEDTAGPSDSLSPDEAVQHFGYGEALVSGLRVVKYSTKKGERAVRNLSLSQTRDEITWV
jgi:hypothetical protein